MGVADRKRFFHRVRSHPSKKSGGYSGAYDVFTITAYLPGQDTGDAEKRLKVRHDFVLSVSVC